MGKLLSSNNIQNGIRRIFMLIIFVLFIYTIQQSYSIENNYSKDLRNVTKDSNDVSIDDTFNTLKLDSIKNHDDYLYIVDGVIFQLQGGLPKGVSSIFFVFFS